MNYNKMSDYNREPEGLKEISLDEWQHEFFMYCLKPMESRQVYPDGLRHGHYALRMFDVPNFDGWKMGLAIKRRYKDTDPKPVITFCRYGTDEQWKTFRGKFAAQFKGDNS